MLEYKTKLTISECEERFNAAIRSFPKKQRERNKIDCFRGKARNGKLSIIFSKPLNYPYIKRHGNIAMVGKMRIEDSVTYLRIKFVSPVLIKSFYIPYFLVIFVILALYGITKNITVLSLYKEAAFFIGAYLLLILATKNGTKSKKDKIISFIKSTMEMDEVISRDVD